MSLSDDLKKTIKGKIILKVSEKNRALACPVCGNNNFILADGVGLQNLQEDTSAVVFGGKSIPQVIIICNHCGNILKFSTGVLNIDLSEGKGNKKKNDE